MYKYSLVQLLCAYAQYKKDKEKEKYQNSSGAADTTAVNILGLGLGVFWTLLVASIIIFIAAIVLLIDRAPSMPTWAVVLSIIFLFLVAGGPLITIVLCLATSDRNRIRSKQMYQGLPYDKTSYVPRNY